jgi:hypothetical protein
MSIKSVYDAAMAWSGNEPSTSVLQRAIDEEKFLRRLSDEEKFEEKPKWRPCPYTAYSKRIGGTDTAPLVEVGFCTLPKGHSGKCAHTKDIAIKAVLKEGLAAMNDLADKTDFYPGINEARARAAKWVEVVKDLLETTHHG